MGQGFVGHVDADDFATGADNLGGYEANFARAAAEIEDSLAGFQMFTGITAAMDRVR